MFTSYRREGLYSRNFLLADSRPQLRRARRVSARARAAGSGKVWGGRLDGGAGLGGAGTEGGRGGGGSALRLLLEDSFPRGYSREVLFLEPKLRSRARQSRAPPPPPPSAQSM